MLKGVYLHVCLWILQGITVMLSLIELQCPPWLNGMELLENLQRNKDTLSTGDKGTDSLLKGGIREGQLTELVGPSSSGKTQVCIHMLLLGIHHSCFCFVRRKTLFIDSCFCMPTNCVLLLHSSILSCNQECST